MTKPLPATCWVLHDGAAGNRRQAVSLAQALVPEFTELELTAGPTALWLAPRNYPGAAQAFGAEFRAWLRQPLQDTLVIGCGRLAGLATRLARVRGARAVQILDPRLSPRHWDWIVAPEHDQLQGGNVISLLGSLHPVDAAWLATQRQLHPQLALRPGPRTAVLLGGPTRATRFDRSALEVLCGKLEFWLARDGGTLMICGSRRTPPEWAPLLRDRYGAEHLVWMDATDGVNPYEPILAWADRIVVSPDSVNMISEACATRAPVYVAEPQRATGRVGRFVARLRDLGRIQPQTREAPWLPVAALQETARVAHALRDRLTAG